MNTTDNLTTPNSQTDSVTHTFKTSPFPLAIGAALALTATFGVLAAYMSVYVGAEDKRPVFWLTIGIFFVVSTIISFIVAKSRQ